MADEFSTNCNNWAFQEIIIVISLFFKQYTLVIKKQQTSTGKYY